MLVRGAMGTRSTGFLACLALVTVFPLVLMAVVYEARIAVPGIFTLFLIAGPFHVATTSVFFFDREFRPVLRDSAARCLWSPLWLPVLIVAVGVTGKAVVGAWALWLLFMVHNIWLFYHYQRQNYGLLSFVSKSFELGRLPEQLSKALNVAAIGALLGMAGKPSFLPGGEELISSPVFQFVGRVGVCVFLVSVVMMTLAMVHEPQLRSNVWLVGGLVLDVAFFLPVFVYDNPLMAVLPIAIAHGAQYVLMMSVLTGRSQRGWVAFLTMCVLGLVIGQTLDDMRAWPLILVNLGIVQSHFLIDAKVWRLREPMQREIITRRFDFLLAR